MSRSTPTKSVTLPNLGVTAVISTPISQNEGVHQGDILLVKVVTPNFTNAITVTVSLFDHHGIRKWQSEALAENSTAEGYAIYPARDIPLDAGDYWSVMPSGDPGAGGGIVTIAAEYRPDVFIKL